MAALVKPPDIESDGFKSEKWDEITSRRGFRASDAPAIALLCHWHKIARQAMDELDGFGGRTAYQGDAGELRAFPQIATLKQASSEIRQLMRQLGMAGEADGGGVGDGGKLVVLAGRRAERRAAASG